MGAVRPEGAQSSQDSPLRGLRALRGEISEAQGTMRAPAAHAFQTGMLRNPKLLKNINFHLVNQGFAGDSPTPVESPANP